MTEKSGPCVIVNPNSANGRTGRHWPEMMNRLHREFPGFSYRMTQRQGHATDLTRDALKEGFRRIFSIGGDGTHNEVLNGFFEEGKAIADDAVLGVLSSGTGSDFRRSLRMPKEFDESVNYLTRARPRRIDVGHLTCRAQDGGTLERYFLNITSFGISGLVDEYVNKTSKALGGQVSFLIGTVRAMLSYVNQPVKLTIDDDFEETLPINSVAVANGQFFGGGMWIAPEAKLNDGQFDIVVIGDITKKQGLLYGPKLYAGSHVEMPEVTVIRGRRVVAESDERVLIDMDGEQPGSLPATLQIHPDAIQILSCVD